MSGMLIRSRALFRHRRILLQQTQVVVSSWRLYSSECSSTSNFTKEDFQKAEGALGSSVIIDEARSDKQDLVTSTNALRLNEWDEERDRIKHESKSNTVLSSSLSSASKTWLDKVVYSSYLEKYAPPIGYKQRLRERFEAREVEKDNLVTRTSIMPPVAFKYLVPEDDDGSAQVVESKRKSSPFEDPKIEDLVDNENESLVQFPYRFTSKPEGVLINTEVVEKEESLSTKRSSDSKLESIAEKLRKLQIDPESVLEDSYSTSSEFESAVEVCIADAGTADPTVRPSNIPCGGCGALLHCQDQSIPGYISSERFTKAKRADLKAEVCYRCSVLEAHQATLDVNVSKEDYPKIVSKIRDQYAMVLLIVDLTDFPCSIWPGLLDIIGTRRPILLVGNKVDLLPQDSPEYLKRVLDSLIKSVVDLDMLDANIIHTALISAKTGYGVENLITKIFDLCKGKGDIFIMGCTNVGKSSLFNTFLQSDLCKPQVCDLVQKATISQWPGTTLNLLKFPMTSPSGWKRYLRDRRLCNEKPMKLVEKKEREIQLRMSKDPELAVLTGHVGKTFMNEENPNQRGTDTSITVNDIFSVNPRSKAPIQVKRPGEWDPNEPSLRGFWVYDTPGAVNTNQILDLLTLPELMISLPKSLIQPRTFFVKPGMSLFIGGLARLDLVEGEYPVRYTLFSNSSLPVTMCLMEDADVVYEKALGTKIFGVPSGGKERLSQFPHLESKNVYVVGRGHTYSSVDLVLSSIGWVAVTVGLNQYCTLSVHTPNGKGIFVRKPSLLPYAVNFKGKRARGTYSYLPHNVYVGPKNFSKQKNRSRDEISFSNYN